MFIESRRAGECASVLLIASLCGAVVSAGCDGSSGAAPPVDMTPQGWMTTTSLAGLDLEAVWGDASDLFAAGRGAKVAHSGDGGMTWNVADTTGLLGAGAGAPVYRHVSGTNGGDVWVAGNTGEDSVLLHSADFGASWQRRDVGGVKALTAVWALDETTIVLGTAHGELFRSHDGGATWTSVAAEAGGTIDAIWGSTDGYVYAVGGRASDAPADTPAVTASPGCNDGGSDQVTTPGKGGADLDGLLMRSTDNGLTWSPIGVAPAGELSNVWGISIGSLIVASGAHESVVMSVDGGATWSVAARRLSPDDFSDVWVDPDGLSFFASSSGVIVGLEYDCTGPVNMLTEPLPLGPGGEPGAVALWGSSKSDLWAVGPGGIIRHRH
jgi:photosystem II stability/assembly factor-like uncharacterized protein